MDKIAELLLPERRIPAPGPPSRIALDMAFGVGAGAILGDKSRYRSHGAITGATWATGLHGKCLDFNPATPSYVEIPASHTQLNFTSESFSIVIRIKVDDLSTIRNLFQRGLGPGDGYYWLIQMNGAMNFLTYAGAVGQTSASSVGSIATGNWYTVGISRTGASVRVYVNGVDDTSVAGVHIDPLTCARTAKIGIHDDKANRPFDGKIEFLRVFGGIALSASEHLAYHNALK